jgi:hypothetical protein
VFLQVLKGFGKEFFSGASFKVRFMRSTWPVGPGMVDPGEAVLDAVGQADAVEMCWKA